MSDGTPGTRSYVGRFGTSIGWAPFQIFMILAATLAKSSAASADLHSVGSNSPGLERHLSQREQADR